MKKIFALTLCSLLIVGCCCAALAEDFAVRDEAASSHILVAYFSRVGNTDFPSDVDASSSASIVVDNGAVMGNIGYMAAYIAETTGGDLFLIETVDKYPVSYDETLDVAADELAAEHRPALVKAVENLDQYDTVFLGYPNWWGDLPPAVYAFLEQNDLNGKTVIPFASSGSSGFSGTQRTLAQLLPDATLPEGLHIAASRVPNSAETLDGWLSGLNIR